MVSKGVANRVPREKEEDIVGQTEGVSPQKAFWLAQGPLRPYLGAGVHHNCTLDCELLLAELWWTAPTEVHPQMRKDQSDLFCL